MRSNQKSWALWLGALFIIAACVFAYITTMPVEANAAIMNGRSSFQA